MEKFRLGLRYIFSSSSSSRIPVSCKLRTRVPAPEIHMRISELAFPPSTGRSCISTTLAPWRAAEMAANIPPMPPPTMQSCVLCSIVLSFIALPLIFRMMLDFP